MSKLVISRRKGETLVIDEKNHDHLPGVQGRHGPDLDRGSAGGEYPARGATGEGGGRDDRSAAMTSKFVSYDIPADPAVLAAVGKVAIAHEQLSDVLRMTYKSLAGIEPSEARRALAYEGARQLRERVRRLSRRELGEGAPLAKLQSMLVESERLTDRRNDFIKGLWAREFDTEAGRDGSGAGQIHDPHGDAIAQPSAQELEKLAEQLIELRNRFNEARLFGFLGEALELRQNKN